VTLTKQLEPAETALPGVILVKYDPVTVPEALDENTTPLALPKTLMLVALTERNPLVVDAVIPTFVFVKSQSRTSMP
jgi:hypothetical protein